MVALTAKIFVVPFKIEQTLPVFPASMREIRRGGDLSTSPTLIAGAFCTGVPLLGAIILKAEAGS
jgi:hypothetical protein